MSTLDPSKFDRSGPTTDSGGSAPGEMQDSQRTTADPQFPSMGSSRWVFIGLILLTVLIYGQGMTRSRGYYGDSFHHLMNGIFVYDAMHKPVAALSDPVQFALNYYMYYPAVNLGYYPPVFSAIMAGMMLVFGVSSTTGQLAVLLMAVVMTVFSFAWFRLRFELPWAATGTVLLIASPLLVYWGRDIMLEVPMMAMVMGAIWAFERILRADRPTWGSAMTWALLSALAFWTKQHALLLLSIYIPTAILSRRSRRFLHPSMLIASVIIAVAAIGLIEFQLSLGGDAVEHSVGTTTQQVVKRFNTYQWTYYFKELTGIVSWPALALSPLGVYFGIRNKNPFVSILLVWPIMFYLMHSYFSVRNPRYGVLWIPPFCALAVLGLTHLAPLLPGIRQRLWIPVVVTCGIAFFLATQVQNPVVPLIYQRVADDLVDRMGPYSCMSYIPDRPARLAACYRLAVEEHRTPEKDLYSFGRILRAQQLHSASEGRWRTPEQADADLKKWNVKFILTEHPPILDRGNQGWRVARMVGGILKLGEFRSVRWYPIPNRKGNGEERTLTLYQRINDLPLNEEADPVIRTRRIPTLISVEGSETE